MSYNEEILNHYGIEKTAIRNDVSMYYRVTNPTNDAVVVSIDVVNHVDVSGEKASRLGEVIKLKGTQADVTSRNAIHGIEQEIIAAFQGVKTKVTLEDHWPVRVLGPGLQISGFLVLDLKQKSWTNAKAEVEELLDRVASKYRVKRARR